MVDCNEDVCYCSIGFNFEEVVYASCCIISLWTCSNEPGETLSPQY
jgi:hypothetical protein